LLVAFIHGDGHVDPAVLRRITGRGCRLLGAAVPPPGAMVDAFEEGLAMRLVTFETPGETARRPGALVDDGVLPLDGDEMISVIATFGDAGPTVHRAREPIPPPEVTLKAPVLPRKIFGIGMNYRDHAAETGTAVPERPIVFGIYPNAVIGPGDPIRIPGVTKQCDYEAELGVVIGRHARDITVDEALDYVCGYLNVNDVSARDLQFSENQWTRSKSFDSFAPMGPWLVTRDEIPDPQALSISCRVNGEVAQESSTAEMVFGVAELVSFVSQALTLWPGDVIATGTPAGVGMARNPPRWLSPGDEVTVEVEGLGALTNPVA
jgi:2-keto-4-pentenoate hydratase/2-oxohepta-3-ene-1,7-dioic acid hydratase in catechol pathway